MRAMIIVCCAALAACGQTGPLYLPDEGVQTPVEIRGPAAPAPAAEPATEDEDKKSDQPPGR